VRMKSRSLDGVNPFRARDDSRLGMHEEEVHGRQETESRGPMERPAGPELRPATGRE
jgi:hypothetical protein